MKIRRYVPAFIDVEDEPDGDVREFNTLDELLKIPFVKRKVHGDFKRFSVSYDDGYDDKRCFLMAEYKDGSYWVTGFVYGLDKKTPILPEWKGSDEDD